MSYARLELKIMKIKELSVFLPAYNEEGSIKNVTLNTKNVLENVADKWELIVINDGSTDSTAREVEDVTNTDKRIKLISHNKNVGYGGSLKTGFYSSKYPWIAFIDSDGQFDFSEITSFIEKQKETNSDLIIGYYKKRQVSKFKILTSKIWELSVFILFGLNVRDIDCGFKLIRKRVIDEIPHLESERGAFISSELLIKAKKRGFKFAEVAVTHYARKTGIGTGRDINVIIRSYIDLFKLWKKLK